MNYAKLCRFCATTLPRWSRTTRLTSSSKLRFTTAVQQEPQADGVPKQYPQKLHHIVDEISKLTLLEVSELNELLKKTLNIPDAPVMAYGSMAQPAAQVDEEEVPEKIVQTSFTLKLTAFDAEKKVQLIKEIKNLIPGSNLVQAKKFVESCPQVIKADVGKDEAEKLAEAVKAAGGTCEVV